MNFLKKVGSVAGNGVGGVVDGVKDVGGGIKDLGESAVNIVKNESSSDSDFDPEADEFEKAGKVKDDEEASDSDDG